MKQVLFLFFGGGASSNVENAKGTNSVQYEYEDYSVVVLLCCCIAVVPAAPSLGSMDGAVQEGPGTAAECRKTPNRD